jgi:putative membrane protein
MKRTICAMLLTAPLLVFAADKSPDESFLKDAAQAGIAEVEAGKLAQEKGSSQAVKDFGAMMVKDHTAAGDKLKTVATAEGVDLPSNSSMTQMAGKTKLEVLSGETFDKAYIKGQVSAHEDTLALLKKEVASGQDAKAKAFATEVLPTVRGHLKKIQKIAADAGVQTK